MDNETILLIAMVISGMIGGIVGGLEWWRNDNTSSIDFPMLVLIGAVIGASAIILFPITIFVGIGYTAEKIKKRVKNENP